MRLDLGDTWMQFIAHDVSDLSDQVIKRVDAYVKRIRVDWNLALWLIKT